jgi:hypothetical protein
MINIVRYSQLYRKQWNEFVASSKNGTFLIDRNYMDYHSDRFEDYSIMAYKNNNLKAILPCSVSNNNILTSHAGLTYGGLLTDHTIRTPEMLLVMKKMMEFFVRNNIKEVYYKTIPHIYHKLPAEEDLYCLFRNNFELYRRDVSSSINIKSTTIKGKKINGAKRAQKLGMELVEMEDCQSLIDLINTNLKEKYGTVATHTAQELNFLKNRFDKNIKFYHAVLQGKILGGAVMFITDTVAHAQYIVTNDEGKSKRALDFMIVTLVNHFNNIVDWFDYGISTENNGHILNESLIKSKEDFNMSAICYDTYRALL